MSLFRVYFRLLKSIRSNILTAQLCKHMHSDNLPFLHFFIIILPCFHVLYQLEFGLLTHLKGKFQQQHRVSVERIVSGTGLANVSLSVLHQVLLMSSLELSSCVCMCLCKCVFLCVCVCVCVCVVNSLEPI